MNHLREYFATVFHRKQSILGTVSLLCCVAHTNYQRQHVSKHLFNSTDCRLYCWRNLNSNFCLPITCQTCSMCCVSVLISKYTRLRLIISDWKKSINNAYNEAAQTIIINVSFIPLSVGEEEGLDSRPLRRLRRLQLLRPWPQCIVERSAELVLVHLHGNLVNRWPDDDSCHATSS